MVKKIVFLVETVFTLRDYERFGIELLQKNGFEVEVWDLTPVLHPIFFQSYVPPDSCNCKEVTFFDQTKQMYERISGLTSDTIVMDSISYVFSNLAVYRALTKSFSEYAIVFINTIPDPIIRRNLLGSLWAAVKKIASYRHLKAWQCLYTNLPYRWLKIKPAKLIFTGGDKSFSFYRHLYPVDSNAKIVQGHALDYDIYLREKDILCTEKPIAVFLDQFLPFGIETMLINEKYSVNIDGYYRTMNYFFDHVEKATGLRVVIAAHPRSNYENLPDYFEGRMCIRGKTVNLIRESQLVLTHCSTANNFANLFYKPMIFVAYNGLNKEIYIQQTIKEMAKWHGKELVYAEDAHLLDFKKEFQVSRPHYDNYRRAYIKADNSEDLQFWQIVANTLKRGL